MRAAADELEITQAQVDAIGRIVVWLLNSRQPFTFETVAAAARAVEPSLLDALSETDLVAAVGCSWLYQQTARLEPVGVDALLARHEPPARLQ